MGDSDTGVRYADRQEFLFGIGMPGKCDAAFFCKPGWIVEQVWYHLGETSGISVYVNLFLPRFVNRFYSGFERIFRLFHPLPAQFAYFNFRIGQDRCTTVEVCQFEHIVHQLEQMVASLFDNISIFFRFFIFSGDAAE